jgi:hypothetical protein
MTAHNSERTTDWYDIKESKVSHIRTRVVIQYLIVLISTLLISSCATHNHDPAFIGAEYESDLKNRLSRVIASDGINKEEAMAICDNYYHRFKYSGCGALGGLEETTNTWNCIVLGGISGKPKPERIIVDNKTGRTTWKYGPDVSVNDLKRIWSIEQARPRNRRDAHASP